MCHVLPIFVAGLVNLYVHGVYFLFRCRKKINSIKYFCAPHGSIIHPQGFMIAPRGCIVYPHGFVVAPQGFRINPQGFG